MKTKKVLLLSLLLLSVSLFSDNLKVDSLLNVLDSVINNKAVYTRAKETRIDSLNYYIKVAKNNDEKYQIYRALFGEYITYNLDSAISIAERRLDVSKKLENKRRINTSKMNIAEVWAYGGMYKDALNILDSIQRTSLEKNQYTYYYHLYFTVYDFLSNYTFKQIEKIKYSNLMRQYKDSLLSTIEPKSIGYFFLRSEVFIQQENFKDALIQVDSAYTLFGHKSVEQNPIFNYSIATLYKHTGNVELEKKYLAMAAIQDIRSATREHIALQKLAMILLMEDDLKRANRYIKSALEDAIACKTNFRTLETAKVFPEIISAYDQKIENEYRQLYISLLAITILTLLLILSIFFIYKQLIKIKSKEKSIQEINVELKTINENLNALNRELTESNYVKEEYIGYVFNLCSIYISKLDMFRKEINIKIKLNQTDKVFKMINHNDVIINELNEFFYNFDTVFMKLYPGFINEFNGLLVKEEQIIPRNDEILTPELRIFALIRLGITDSSKIAKFLNFAPQTVYNYRVKMRNKSVLPKEDFMQAIQKIGLNH